MKTSKVMILAAVLICCMLFGCGKEPTNEPVPTNKTTTVYGAVFNAKTHEPVVGAQVEIGGTDKLTYDENAGYYGHIVPSSCQRYSSSVSGSDGLYELIFEGDFGDDWDYQYLFVKCEGYYNYYSTTNFSIGGSSRMDINIHPSPSKY